MIIRDYTDYTEQERTRHVKAGLIVTDSQGDKFELSHRIVRWVGPDFELGGEWDIVEDMWYGWPLYKNSKRKSRYTQYIMGSAGVGDCMFANIEA